MNTENQVKTRTKTYATPELANLCGVIAGLVSVLVKEQSLKPVKAEQDNAEYYDAGVLE